MSLHGFRKKPQNILTDNPHRCDRGSSRQVGSRPSRNVAIILSPSSTPAAQAYRQLLMCASNNNSGI
ncbi:hypothetical protein J6590_054005 [Homalodisca vitripennis]|nr:hypothetical protein J6590_054005 [Homalodisca vitripennis]